LPAPWHDRPSPEGSPPRSPQKTRPRPFPEAAGEGHTRTVRPVVLGDVSPEVGLSEGFGLFGPDGAGKTTLVNAP